ncbi:hypothetical protein [Microvirga sp. G4-2]|uniref:hypothetical protein n=1 Tax=Microvirga sp. G4-2 TaxID=3434467 RepID=UPI0040449679
MAGEVPMVITHALSEIKDALRELRHSTPDSILIRLAEQKIAMIERGYYWANQDSHDADWTGLTTQNA